MSSKKSWTLLPIVALAAALASGAGCSSGEPECSCTPRTIAFGTVQSAQDTLEATFTVENRGEGDRLTWFIENRPELGLSVREPGLYVLDSGESMEYTLVFAPQDSITEQTVDYRVGLGDCTIAVTLGALASPEPGACCLADGSCTGDVTQAECEGDLGGTFQGEGSTCAGVSCPQPEPAICRISPSSIDFVFDLSNVSTTLRDTLTVRNAGGRLLTGTVNRFSCSGVTLTPLDNLDAELRFSLEPGDSAQVEVAAVLGSSCTVSLQTNASVANNCPPVQITSRFQAGTVERSVRR